MPGFFQQAPQKVLYQVPSQFLHQVLSQILLQVRRQFLHQALQQPGQAKPGTGRTLAWCWKGAKIGCGFAASNFTVMI